MTDEERARRWAETRAESERLLSCDFSKPPPPDEQPTPAYEPPPEDPVSKWRREADEQQARFEAARAERKREEREDKAARTRAAQVDWDAWNRWCDGRINAALAEQRDSVAELARGSVEFSNAICARLRQMETMLEQLSTKLTELRAADDLRQRSIIDMPNPLRPRSVN